MNYRYTWKKDFWQASCWKSAEFLVADGSQGVRSQPSLGHHNVCGDRLVFRKIRVLDCGVENDESDLKRVKEGAI